MDPARSREAIVLTGHYDSRASDVMDAVSDAPGAIDDASGVALVLELARVMARERPAISVYFVAVAGEEQGLTGSAHLARRLRAEGVSVLAMIAVDTVGNTDGMDGAKDDVSARLFSEGVPHGETEPQRRLREAHRVARTTARRASWPATWSGWRSATWRTWTSGSCSGRTGSAAAAITPASRARDSPPSGSPRRTSTTTASTRCPAPRAAAPTETTWLISTRATWPG